MSETVAFRFRIEAVHRNMGEQAPYLLFLESCPMVLWVRRVQGH